NPDPPNFEIATATITVPSAGSGSGAFTFNNNFEPNETSDQAIKFGDLVPTLSFQLNNQSILNHLNGLPDYDWFRWTATAAGTVTATYKISKTNGELEMHLWTLQGNTLIELTNMTSNKGGDLTAVVKPGQVILVEVKGRNSSVGVHDQGNYTL